MLRIAMLFVAVLAGLGALVWAARDLPPPDTVRFAAGTEGGGYWRIAERYRARLRRDGIDLVLIPTAGSVENARLLASGEADAGLLQGGIPAEAGIESLGAVFTEPLLIFARTEAEAVPRNVALWQGLRLAVGGEGSGTRAATAVLLRGAGLEADEVERMPVGGAASIAALRAGEVDLALFVAPLSAPYLADALADPAIELIAPDHVVALSRRMPQSVLVDVPSGAFGMDPPLPPRDRRLIGLVAQVAARDDLHPAAVDRLVMAARSVHRRGDVISPAGAYPTMTGTSLPQNPQARDMIAEGPSTLYGLLPYWIVAQISRVAILLLPIVFLTLPLLRALPGLYRFGIRRRVFVHYARIRAIEEEAERATDAAALRDLTRELDEIERQIAAARLPLGHRDFAYDVRLHIDLLRKRIAERLGRPAAGA